MGAQIPESYAESELSRSLKGAEMERLHQGKVRDTWRLPGWPELLLLTATDRLSIFDFVLPGFVRDKGAVLTALTVFWMTEVIREETHLVAFGSELDAYLPGALVGDRDLFARGMVVKRLDMLPVECVARGYLSGSGFSAYRDSREVCGHKLPEGLHDGARLPEPIFTPTTKAESGHDEHVPAESVTGRYGPELERMTLNIYAQIAGYAREHGIILADTKFEFGQDGVLGDEVGTPDSSRFWDMGEWEAAVREKRSPAGYDKQPVREWGKTVRTPFSEEGRAVTGLHRLNPENPGHVAFVHGLEVPEAVLTATTGRYRRIFERLTGMSLEGFQEGRMGISTGDSK